MGRFDGRVALLTGAASGIGRATALRFAAEGATVVGADVDTEGLGETEGLIGTEGSFSGVSLDVTDRDACFAVVDRVVDEHGRLDVLGNIAGVTRIHHFVEATEAEVELMMAVNAKGPLYLCQAAIPHLLQSEHGNIVNIASNAGLMGTAYTVAYCASKGAIVQLTRALAIEFEKTSLRVNAVAPGGVDTPMTDGIPFPDDADFNLFQGVMSPRGRSSPDDIAAVVAFVASDEARRMHGSIVCVDDGLVAG